MGIRKSPRSKDAAKGRVRRLSPKRRNRAKTVLACLFVGVLLALPIPFVNTAIGYLPFISFVFILLLSWIYVHILKKCLVYDQLGVEGGCLRGERLSFKFVIENRSILPVVSTSTLFFVSDLFGDERESSSRTVSLPPRSSKMFEFAVMFDHIGTYSVGISEVDVTDPFGVFHVVTEFHKLQEVHVQPRLSMVPGIEISPEASKESSRAVTTVIDDGMDYCGVREYRWGDPIKAIHWKLSARVPEGDYFTRLYETSRNPGLAFLIDCDAPDRYSSEQLMDVYDGVVESALSIEAWASSCAYETELLFNDAAGRHRRFEGPLTGRYGQILARLPRISPGDGRALINRLREESSSIYSQDNLVVCTALVSDELVGELLRVKAGHHTPILVAVMPNDDDKDEQKRFNARISRLGSAKIRCMVLAEAADLGVGGE